LTILVVWKAVEELNGSLFAMILSATAVLLSALLRLNLLYQPNSLDVLCWTAFYFCILKYFKSGKNNWIYFSAIVFAIGFLNKYNIAFLVIGILPALLISEHRKEFKRKDFYLALVLVLLLISPNLLWQYHNNFPVLTHMKELSETQLIYVNRWDFLREQIFFYIGSIFVILAAFWALVFYTPFKKFRFFLWSLCLTLMIFIVLKAKGYYAIGIYPIYIAFGAVYLGELLKNSWRRYLQPIAVLLPILVFAGLYNFVFPTKSPEYIVKHPDVYRTLGLLHWEDGQDHQLPQDFADMLGWKELALQVDSSFSNLPNADQTLVLCDNYGQAGAINFYTKNKNLSAVSFNNDYINWFNIHKKYVNLIRIKTFENSKTELNETKPYFKTAYLGGSVKNPLAREYGTRIYVFQGAKVDINERMKKEIKEYQRPN
jgi:hypothetical protein